MIAPGYQRKGLARWMVPNLEKEARERGYESIRLDVCVRNFPAMRLCASLGCLETEQFRVVKGTFACVEKSMERIEC